MTMVDPGTQAAGLAGRLAALDTLVELGTGRLDQTLIDDAVTLLGRAGDRLRLSGQHTVVALAGGTGSGKSSLFNSVAGLELSPVGVKRPTTGSTHACVWGLDGAGSLLDWLGVDKRYRYARASALDNVESSLQGLVLLDLPDHDSIRAENAAEADRFVAVADLLVWVLDPQKYADAAVHRRYLTPLARHTGVSLVVLSQVDRLKPEEVHECVRDLRRLLEAEGMQDPRVLTTSVVTEGGADGFRDVLTDAVAARRARAGRLAVDLDELIGRFEATTGEGDPPPGIGSTRESELVGALSDAAGVPAVAEAMESAYDLRAGEYVGWPVARAMATLRRDPLRRLRLTELRDELRSSVDGPSGVQQAVVDNALHEATSAVAAALPPAWQRSLRAAGRSRAEELPEELGRALRDVVPAFNQLPKWWWLVRALHWVLVVAGIAGLVWLGALVAFGVLEAGSAPFDLVGDTAYLPYAAGLTVGLFGLGASMGPLFRRAAERSGARHSEQMEERMRECVATAAREMAIEPVERELAVYTRFREEVATARL